MMKQLCYHLTIFIGLIDTISSINIISGYITNNRLGDFNPQCQSEIYCHGNLLHTVQMSGMHKDSKTFVDMKMKSTPNETLAQFEDFMNANNQSPSKDKIKEWVNKMFEKPGSEFEDWDPVDWKENPSFLKGITDDSYREWANELHKLWHSLGRKMIPDVAISPEQYSIIHVENPVIVPGGRFREFYYWDSYWIIKGLLLSEMFDTTKGMLSNFLSIVDRFGFVPNGGRIYYSARSQPPLLAGMLKAYVETTNDTEFAQNAVETLEREFQFWMNNHIVEVNGHLLAIYGDKSKGPRPESYREDVETASVFKTDDEKEEYYSELKAGAESGMDFSSRWFINDQGSNEGKLTDLKTRSIVPVDLNAILYWNAKIIAEFYGMKNNLKKVVEYEAKASEIFEAIQSVLWRDDIGAWLDYDMLNKKHREYFCPSNLFPLWVECFNKADANITNKVLEYIEKTGIDKYPGGVPNTLEHTGEQWDFPNVWPPLQYVLIMGIDLIDDERAKSLAYKWAERWVRSNYAAYEETKAMFEKYNAEEVGGHGGGGEYEIQLGFGWTNGVIMDLLNKYGDRMTTENVDNNIRSSASVIRQSSTSTGFAMLVVALSVG